MYRFLVCVLFSSFYFILNYSFSFVFEWVEFFFRFTFSSITIYNSRLYVSDGILCVACNQYTCSSKVVESRLTKNKKKIKIVWKQCMFNGYYFLFPPFGISFFVQWKMMFFLASIKFYGAPFITCNILELNAHKRNHFKLNIK